MSRNLQKYFLSVSISILVTPLAAEKLTLAVLDLRAGPGVESEATTVTDIIDSDMVKADRFKIVERGSKMKEVMQEQAFQQTGLTEGQVAQIGRSLGAQKVLIGSLTKLGSNYIIVGKIVDVQTARVDFSEEVKSKSLDDLYDAAHEFASKMDDHIAAATAPRSSWSPSTRGELLWRSALLPGWGQMQGDERGKGLLFVGSTIGVGLYDVFLYRQYERAQSAYKNGVGLSGILMGSNTYVINTLIFQGKQNQYDGATRRLNQGVGLLGLIYAVNIADIIFFSPKVSAGAEIERGGMYASFHLRF